MKFASVLLSLGLLTATFASAQNDRGARLQKITAKNHIHRNLDYVGDGNQRQFLDLYVPKQPASDAIPLVVWIHGGAWAKGSKEAPLRMMPFAERNDYAVASINYRLTNEASWPAQLHDCKAAIRYLRAKAGEHGIDPKRIGIAGSSAGGHLVSALGTMGADMESDGDLGPHTEVSTEVTCVVDYFGPVAFVNPDGKTAPQLNNPGNVVYKLIGGAPSEHPEKARHASPIYHITKDDPPFLLIHGTKDALVRFDVSVKFEQELERVHGSDVPFLRVNGGGHGRGFGPAVEQTLVRFMDHHLHERGEPVQDRTVQAGE